MRWSWKIARIAGIDIYVHSTMLILLAWIAAAHYMQRHDWQDAAGGLIFIATLFGIVLLHELGHALAARHFGIPTRDITLWPMGGVARLERMSENPKEELLIALAGPAVNVALAASCFVVLTPVSGLAAVSDVALVGGQFLAKLFWVNVVLAVFNILPAFPMDGGRVLRALLAMTTDYVRATQIAAAVGQGMALLFGIAGLLLPNPMLIFVALFVWMGAAQEAAVAQMRAAASGIPVERAMATDYPALTPSDRLSRAVDMLLSGRLRDVPVVDHGRLVGVLTRDDLLRILARHVPDMAVAEAMQRDFLAADPREMLGHVFDRTRSRQCDCMPVVRDGRLVGMMSRDDLGRLFADAGGWTRRRAG